MRLITQLLRVGAASAVLISAGAALASLGGFWKSRLDLLTHFSPLWLAVCAAALLSVPLLKLHPRRLLLAVAAAGAAASAWLMTPELLAAGKPAEVGTGPEQRLRVVSLNLWVRNADAQATAAWLLNSGADVLVLPEPEGAAVPVIRRLRERYPHGVDCRRRSDCPVAVLSRWPVISSGARHPYSWARVRAPGGDVTVLGVHYTWPTDGWRQQWQRQRVAEAIEGFGGRDLIVAGDFNSTPWSFAMERQDREFGLERRTRALFSWPAALPFPLLPIDHLYAGDDWRTVSIRRGPRLGSDHYPIVVDLAR